MDKKYIMIVTCEDERYGTVADGRYGTVGYQLSHWMDNPWDGLFIGIASGNTFEELEKLILENNYEGLFYQLYSNETGVRIGYGIIDYDSIEEEIEECEKHINHD